MTDVFCTVGKIVTGAGCFASLPEHVRGLGKKCLIVTGRRALQEQGVIARLEEMLRKTGIATCILSGIGNDPEIKEIEEGVSFFHDDGCDLVLGIGGGSCLDAAKAVAKFAGCGQAVREVFDGQPFAPGGYPLVAIPTTFGTGSEVTRVTVLQDSPRKLKRGLRDVSMLPALALVDPELGRLTPPGVVARSGLDALTQAIESFLSRHATDITEALAYNAFVLLSNALPRVMADPADDRARADCANGSLMAGMAFSNSGLGIVHGFANPLGGRYDIRHGEVCGIVLPYALRFNEPAAERKYALLSGSLGMDAADWVRQKLRDFDLPGSLKPFKIPAADFDLLVPEVMASASTKANIRDVSEHDVRELLREMC